MDQQLYAREVTGSTLATNKVLRSTYLLLSLTLLFSAVTAWVSVVQNAAPINPLLFIVLLIGLSFGISATRNSALGLVLTFVYTGFVGWAIGPMLSFYLKTFSNGGELIMMALGGTGLIFLVLSLVGMNATKDYSRWGRFLFAGILIALVASVVNIFFLKLPLFQLALSVIFSFIAGGLIIFQTNQIVRGGETNYIIATVTLYASLLQIFLTLLQILGMLGGNRNS